METYKKVILILSLIGLSGCAAVSTSIKTPKVVLLPEDRIFTVPAGQEISVQLDGKPLTMTFPSDMKLVSPTVLVRQEEKLNDALLDKTKANVDKKKQLGIFGGILSILATVLGIWFKVIPWFKGFQVVPKK